MWVFFLPDCSSKNKKLCHVVNSVFTSTHLPSKFEMHNMAGYERLTNIPKLQSLIDETNYFTFQKVNLCFLVFYYQSTKRGYISKINIQKIYDV